MVARSGFICRVVDDYPHYRSVLEKLYDFLTKVIFDAFVKSLISDGFVKSPRSRLANPEE
ncbi:hypothetical protein DESC_480154 [Desulfosarcina cetonica]|nr:hypothetical protein DESC_480154 [Desulfosarcina cetonica]